jgi:hypothetical protein
VTFGSHGFISGSGLGPSLITTFVSVFVSSTVFSFLPVLLGEFQMQDRINAITAAIPAVHTSQTGTAISIGTNTTMTRMQANMMLMIFCRGIYFSFPQ